MKISYKKTVLIFFAVYLAVILTMGFFVRNRIETRQITLQLFLRNGLDIDRQITTQRSILRETLNKAQYYLLITNSDIERKTILNSINDDLNKFSDFWKKYQRNYSVAERPFLLKILTDTQELNLVDEESMSLDKINIKTKAYLAYILSDISGNIGNNDKFLVELNKKRQEIYDPLNQLADLRYIFAQRAVFFISGENDRQGGMFTSVFLFLFFSFLIIAVLEYLFIHKPVGDIMSFLRDSSQGKKGQQLYFSSVIKEIKESEEIINEIVKKAENK